MSEASRPAASKLSWSWPRPRHTGHGSAGLRKRRWSILGSRWRILSSASYQYTQLNTCHRRSHKLEPHDHHSHRNSSWDKQVDFSIQPTSKSRDRLEVLRPYPSQKRQLMTGSASRTPKHLKVCKNLSKISKTFWGTKTRRPTGNMKVRLQLSHILLHLLLTSERSGWELCT